MAEPGYCDLCGMAMDALAGALCDACLDDEEAGDA